MNIVDTLKLIMNATTKFYTNFEWKLIFEIEKISTKNLY